MIMVYLYSVLCCLFLFPYLGWRGGSVLGQRARRFFRGLLGGIFLLFVVALLVHRHIQADWMSDVMNGSIYIFFSTMYAAGVVFAFDILKFVDRRTLSLYAGAKDRTKRWLQAGVFALSLVVFFGTMVVGHQNVRYPRVVHHDLYISRLTPQGAKAEKRLRLVFFSDLHIGEAMTPDYISRSVDLILQQKPDLILCGGDYIDHREVYAYDPRVLSSMRRLRAPLGVYFVLGNHEYRDHLDENIRFVSEIGATLLRDSVTYPADSLLALIGRDDAVQGDRAPFAQITQRVDPSSRPVLLMEHTPGSLDSIGDSPIDLMLCGHTHGGQIWPGQLLTWWRYGMSSGTRRVGDKEICVSSGIGSAGATYRIGTRSEIRVYDLYW